MTLTERVKPLLSAQVSSTSIQAGEPLTFSGTIAPAHAGSGRIPRAPEPRPGSAFTSWQPARSSSGGAYSIEHTVSGAGTLVFRIKVPGDGEDAAVASELLKVQVTRAPDGPLEPPAPGTGSTPAGES